MHKHISKCHIQLDLPLDDFVFSVFDVLVLAGLVVPLVVVGGGGVAVVDVVVVVVVVLNIDEVAYGPASLMVLSVPFALLGIEPNITSQIEGTRLAFS